VLVLSATLLAVPSCLGDVDDGTADAMGGAGGTPATAGTSAGLAGADTGGTVTGGAAASGGSGGGEGGNGGGAGFGGVPFADPADDFIFVWTGAELPLAEGDGSYDFIVDWGDGTSNEITSATDTDKQHDYATPGPHVVTIRGTFEGLRFGEGCSGYWNPEWGEDEDPACNDYVSLAPDLDEIRQWGSFRFGAVPSAFEDASNLVVTATDTPDLSPPTTLVGAFEGCSKVEDIPSLDQWDVSHITNMAAMFRDTPFNGDLSTWDTSSVNDMAYMFEGTTAFNGDLSGWDTSQVTSMAHMFANAISFDGNLSAWDTSSVIGMSGTFQGALAFNGDISSWDTSSVRYMNAMFSGASSFDQDLSAWDIGALTEAADMFSDSGLSTAHYDAILISWAAQETQDNVEFGAEGIQYSTAAVAARAVLTEERGWNITDGGLAP